MSDYPTAYRSSAGSGFQRYGGGSTALSPLRQFSPGLADLPFRPSSDAGLPPYLRNAPFRPSGTYVPQRDPTGPRMRPPHKLPSYLRRGMPTGYGSAARTALGGLRLVSNLNPMLRALNGAMNAYDLYNGLFDLYGPEGTPGVHLPAFLDKSQFVLIRTCDTSRPHIGWVENNLNFCPPQQAIQPGYGQLHTATRISSVAAGTLGRVRIRDQWERSSNQWGARSRPLENFQSVHHSIDPMSIPIGLPTAPPSQIPWRMIPLLRANPWRSEQSERGPTPNPVDNPSRRPTPLSPTVPGRAPPNDPPTHVKTPPPKRTKEQKFKGSLGVAGILMGAASEGGDIIGAFYDALPNQYKVKWPDGSVKQRVSFPDQAAAVYRAIGHMDGAYLGQVAANLVKNHIQDAIIGGASGAASGAYYGSGYGGGVNVGRPGSSLGGF